MLIAAVKLQSSPLAVVIVALVLFGISRPIIRKVAETEENPWLERILTISLVLHLLAALAQVIVVTTLYHGVSDWHRYTIQGSLLAPDFRTFNFTLAHANVRGIVNDGSVSIITGAVMAIVGVNLVATFMVFAWLSFLGTILFYKAFTLTFPSAVAGHRRYAYLIFFLPSILFWTADSSKEAIMTVSLGICAYGIAKVLRHAPGGFTLLAIGVIPGYLVRPNELMVILGGFAVALMVRSGVSGQRFSGIRRISGLLFMGLLVGISVYMTIHYLHIGSGAGQLDLQKIGANNSSGSGAGFGSSGVNYHSSPLYLPIDAYTVLFDPLGFNAHGTGEYVASLENLILLGVFISSYRQLRIIVRTAFCRPYVMMCLVYSLGFVYAFAGLGNLGLIYRERVMLLPFLLVLLSIPRTPKGRPSMFEWEYRRKDRKQFRVAMLRREANLRALRMAAAAERAAPSAGRPVPVGAGAPAGTSRPGAGADTGPSDGPAGTADP